MISKKPMIPRIKSFSILDNYKMLVCFDDGKQVNYDVGDDIRSLSAFHPLVTQIGLYKSAQLDKRRTCIYWNEQIDLPSDTIYQYGLDITPANA